jgi:hypothetical protein
MYFVFDLLYLNGEDPISVPLVRRREIFRGGLSLGLRPQLRAVGVDSEREGARPSCHFRNLKLRNGSHPRAPTAL